MQVLPLRVNAAGAGLADVNDPLKPMPVDAFGARFPFQSRFLAVTVAPDHDLAAGCARFLADAGFWGLAELQFMRGPDGPALIDVRIDPSFK